MVIYARGGSKGTAAEAESRTGRWESVEKLLVKSLHLCFFPLYTASQYNNCMNTACLSVCV